LRATAELLAAWFRPATGFTFKIESTKSKITAGDILLTTKNANTNLGAEGYELSVLTNVAVIRAATSAGVFYGTQSLLQLLPSAIFSAKRAHEMAWTIPCVEISDSPCFQWRGFMLDVSRHFFTKTEVEQVLDLMAFYKLNTFHWHLVDNQGWRIQIKKYPKLTEVGAWRGGIGFGLDPKSATAYDKHGRYGGFYTQRDIHEVVAYAAARHITIVPEIEMPAHSSAALTAYPQFACANAKISIPETNGDDTGVYCAGNDATFTFLKDVLTEVGDLFPGKYIHIGGDEVVKSNWQNCAKCQLRIKTEHLKDERELQAYFIRRIEEIVNADGKNLIGWSEIREGGLASSAALMDWIGGGAESAASGHDVVMTPTKFCYFDYYQSTNHAAEPMAIGGFLPLELVYQFEPVPEKLAPKFYAHVLGGQANLWTEYVPNLRQVEYMMFPRLGALSEVDWSPKTARDWNNFQTRAALNEKRLNAMGVNYRPLAKPE
jgi:hexosaminidase